MKSPFRMLCKAMGASKDASSVQSILSELDPSSPIEENDTGFQCIFSGHGVELAFGEDGLLNTVFFYPSSEEGFISKPYSSELLEGIRFPATLKEFSERLGNPIEQRPRQTLFNLVVPATDVYQLENCLLHVEHGDDGLSTGKVMLVRQ